jgi:hypothetical protein
VQRLERAEAPVGLAVEELAELLAFDELTDHHHDLALADVGDLLVVVLHQDRAVPQGVELAGVGDGGLARGVAVGVVELGRPADAGVPLDDAVNLALPATSERGVDDVLSGDAPARLEIEPLDLRAGPVHGPNIIGAGGWGVKRAGLSPGTRRKTSEQTC